MYRANEIYLPPESHREIARFSRDTETHAECVKLMSINVVTISSTRPQQYISLRQLHDAIHPENPIPCQCDNMHVNKTTVIIELT